MANGVEHPFPSVGCGVCSAELLSEGIRPEHIPHRTFKGNRPSLSLLLPKLTAYTTGQLLALYEHRTAVQVGEQPSTPTSKQAASEAAEAQGHRNTR